jgi:hypothetical protein
MTPLNPLAHRQLDVSGSSSASPNFQNSGSPVPWNLKLDRQPPDLSPERVEIGMPVPASSSMSALRRRTKCWHGLWEPCISTLKQLLST